MIAKQRLFHIADKSALVPEDNVDAAFLYASVGDEIPESAAELYGLVDGGLPDFDGDDAETQAADKAATEAADKAATEADDKAATEAADKAATEAADKAAARGNDKSGSKK